MVIVMVCFDKIIQTYVKLGMDYYYFTKVTNINHINYIQTMCSSFLVVFNADDQNFEGTVFRHQQTSAESILKDFYVLVQIILSYAYVNVDL